MNKPRPGSISQARPLRADAERNRRRVLEVAEEVFAEKGIAVPIDEIARRAGLGVGTLYRHFPTKEALITAIVATRMQEQTERLRLLLEHGERGPDTFFDFLTEMVNGWRQKKDFMEALSNAGADLEDIKRVKVKWLERLGKLLEQAQEDGHVRQGVTCGEIIALIAGTFVSLERHGISKAGGDRMLAIVFDGLRASAPGATAAATKPKARRVS